MAVERLAALGIPRYESPTSPGGLRIAPQPQVLEDGAYQGFGADAHSFDGGVRWQNPESVAEYVEKKNAGEDAGMAGQRPAPTLVEERFFLGLRLTAGICPSPRILALFRAHPPLSGRRPASKPMAAAAFRLTNRGMLFSNEVFQES